MLPVQFSENILPKNSWNVASKMFYRQSVAIHISEVLPKRAPTYPVAGFFMIASGSSRNSKKQSGTPLSKRMDYGYHITHPPVEEIPQGTAV